ncbi:MAG TPA: putative baseplate assembly protein, partial [Longimicrobium sp.]|nr:putative baseplate assembly protein [Longimicrobium sp.]
LRGSDADLALRQGDAIIFEEVVGAESGLPQDADLSHRHVVRLSERPRQRIDPIGNVTVLEIAWHSRDALPFALCLRWKLRDGERRPAAVARGNVILADHGRTFPASPVWTGSDAPPWEALALPVEGRRFRPPLDRPGATFARPYDESRARGEAAAAILDADLRTVRAAVELLGAGTEWTPRRDLLNSRPFSADFVVEAQEDGRASLRFGDGVHGRGPAAGTAMTARYRIGGGRAGNVGADSLVRIAALPGPAELVSRVRNPLPADGGTDPEPLEKVRLHAPYAFRTQERAVTAEDYAAAAERHPEVQRAAATRRWTGSWYTIFVTVDRVGGLPVDAEFEAGLRDFLERFRMAGYDLEIDAPRFAPLDVAFSVCAKPGYSRGDVRQALIRELGTGELPDGRRAFFHPDEWTFGQPVYLSQLVARAMGVAGVDWVDFAPSGDAAHRFQRLGRAAAGELQDARITMGRLEVARLDNDPSAPENGKLEIHMRGGS